MIKKLCKRCGKEFESYPSLKRKYCSDCHYTPKQKIKCKVCGKIFYAAPSHKRKVCNWKCYSKLRSIFWSGENNPNWKGNKATYSAFHYRVEKIRGKPKKCEECGTIKAKKFEWANQTGNFKDIYDYKRLCTSCHRKYDNN